VLYITHQGMAMKEKRFASASEGVAGHAAIGAPPSIHRVAEHPRAAGHRDVRPAAESFQRPLAGFLKTL
jgi:hypothetical protein